MQRWFSSSLLIAIIFGAHFTNLAVAQATDQAELMRRLQALEQRVDRLENGGSTSPQSSNQRGQSVWRKLSLGLGMGQVRAILGEPDKIDTYTSFTNWHWNYPSGGSIQFNANGFVQSIHEP